MSGDLLELKMYDAIIEEEREKELWAAYCQGKKVGRKEIQTWAKNAYHD